MTSIANRTRTDKGSVTGQGHGYTLLYDLLFGHRRLEPLSLLEVGLAIGGPELATGSADRKVTDAPSVALWREYFPNAQIVGVDISDFSAFETDWFKFVRADCGDAQQLAKVADLGRQFDIIIDDGSHAAFHQQRTLLSLWPLLKPGGLFVIEDMQWQPDTYAGSLPAVPRTDLLFARYLNTGLFTDTGAIPEAEWAEIAPEINLLLQFDEDWFYKHRRQFNARDGVSAQHQVIWDQPAEERRSFRGFWSRLAGRVRSEVEGGEGPNARPRVKLAALQKGWD